MEVTFVLPDTTVAVSVAFVYEKNVNGFNFFLGQGAFERTELKEGRLICGATPENCKRYWFEKAGG